MQNESQGDLSEQMRCLKSQLHNTHSIHSFIMHSVNPYKVNQPIGYRVCHNANVI